MASDDEQQQQQHAMQTGPSPAWGSVPVPDPTKLTSEAVGVAKEDLRRDLATQRELLSERISRLEKIIADLDQRFSNEIGRRIDASYSLLAQRDDSIVSELKTLSTFAGDSAEVHDALRQRLQTDIAIAVRNLKELHEEKFAGIQQQFTERDIRADQDKRASKDALDAALLAQKEAVAQQNDANTTAATKTETNFTKQIDLVGTQITALDKSLSDRLGELKERIDRGEGSTAGSVEQRAEHRLDRTEGISSVVAVVMSISVIISIISVILVVVLHK